MKVSASLASNDTKRFVFELSNPADFSRLRAGDDKTSGGAEVTVAEAPEEYQGLVGAEVTVYFNDRTYIFPTEINNVHYPIIFLARASEVSP